MAIDKDQPFFRMGEVFAWQKEDDVVEVEIRVKNIGSLEPGTLQIRFNGDLVSEKEIDRNHGDSFLVSEDITGYSGIEPLDVCVSFKSQSRNACTTVSKEEREAGVDLGAHPKDFVVDDVEATSSSQGSIEVDLQVRNPGQYGIQTYDYTLNGEWVEGGTVELGEGESKTVTDRFENAIPGLTNICVHFQPGKDDFNVCDTVNVKGDSTGTEPPQSDFTVGEMSLSSSPSEIGVQYTITSSNFPSRQDVYVFLDDDLAMTTSEKFTYRRRENDDSVRLTGVSPGSHTVCVTPNSDGTGGVCQDIQVEEQTSETGGLEIIDLTVMQRRDRINANYRIENTSNSPISGTATLMIDGDKQREHPVVLPGGDKKNYQNELEVGEEGRRSFCVDASAGGLNKGDFDLPEPVTPTNIVKSGQVQKAQDAFDAGVISHQEMLEYMAAYNTEPNDK